MSEHSESIAIRGRRGARRLAVQAVYQGLVAGADSAALVAEFLGERAAKGIDQAYFRELVTGALSDRVTLDNLLQSKLDRAAAEIDPVEHAILLVGALELREQPELAIPIVINEAVELAKIFGADKGHRFVNGVLDHLATDLRPNDVPRCEGGNCG